MSRGHPHPLLALAVLLSSTGIGIGAGRVGARRYMADLKPAELGLPPLSPTSTHAIPLRRPAPRDAGAARDAVTGTRPGSERPPPDPSLPTRGVPGAAVRGDLAALQRALSEGQSLQLRDTRGRTLTALAAEAGQAEVLAFLADHGLLEATRTHDGRTPLMLAAAAGMVEATRTRIAQGDALETRDRRGMTALHHAATAGHAEVVHLLLAQGSAVDARCARGHSALLYAAAADRNAAAAALLEGGAGLELRDQSGATALSVSADRGNPTLVAALLEAGAEVDTENHAGLTPLGYALSRRAMGEPGRRERYDELAERLARAGARFERLAAEGVVEVIDRKRYGLLAARFGAAPLPARTRQEAAVPDGVRRTRDGAALQLMAVTRRRGSRSFPNRVDQHLQIFVYGELRSVNVVRQVRVSGLHVRAGQRLTLAGDPHGQWGFGVDDALLLSPGDDPRGERFTGIPDRVLRDGRRVRRIGKPSYRFGADQIDVTDTFRGSEPVDVRLIDWGGAALVGEVFLRVHGSAALETLGRVKVETL